MLATAKGDSAKAIKTVNQNSYGKYASVHYNLGQVFAYEPLYGYALNKKNMRLTADNPAYRGEFYPAKGKITGIFWSPNRIDLETAPNTVVLVNQNPGSYWRDGSGKKLFPKMRAFEVNNKHFFATSDEANSINLRLVPPLHEIALYTSAVAAVMFLLFMLYLKRSKATGE